MGNALATAAGDTLTCFRTHENQGSVSRGAAVGSGRDIDDAVLAATDNIIDAQNNLHQVLRLNFGCKKLPNLDTFTRTDGMAVLFEKRGNMWQQLGMTEVIMDSLDPEWVKCFDVPYKFEEQQNFKIVVYDIDDFDNLLNFKNHDLVGELHFTLHEVVTAKDQVLIRPISKQKKDSVIEITGEELEQQSSNDQVIMAPVLKFENGNYKGEILFFLVYRMHSRENAPGRGNHIWRPVYKSEIKSQSNNRGGPTVFKFNQLSILVDDLCAGDLERDVKIEFFKSQKNGKHQNLGQTLFSVDELKNPEAPIELFLTKQKKACVTFDKLLIQKRNSFLEYIFGGCELNLAIAVDFTLSNGPPHERDSLHQFNMHNNEYHKALKSVGDILQFYDTDKQFPCFGFGGKLRTGVSGVQKASHCFALNGNIFDPECDGLDGILEAYKHSLSNVDLYGPTWFSEVLTTVNDMSEHNKCSQTNQKYQIVLILTDGIINDMQKTIDQIVRGSELPLSIIIVGVGSADFSSMDQLDADDEPLYSQKYKKYMSSDIVQFVPFSEFKHDPRLLAKETLEEVPRQFLSFMERNNIVPKSVHEFEKRKIRDALRNQKSLKSEASMVKEAPDFFKDLEEKFINELTEMGYDFIDVKDFIEDKGLPEYSHDLCIDALSNKQGYRNPLFVVQPQLPQNTNASINQISIHLGQQHYSQAPQGVPVNLKGNLNKPNFSYEYQTDIQNQDQGLCKVCLHSPINTVVVPCGHRCLCDSCGKQIKQDKKAGCPVCRQPIKQIVKTFDS